MVDRLLECTCPLTGPMVGSSAVRCPLPDDSCEEYRCFYSTSFRCFPSSSPRNKQIKEGSAKEGDGAGETGLGERGSRAQQRVQVDAGLGPVLHSPAYSGYFLLSRIAAADCAGRGNRACVGRSRAAAVCSLELQHDAAIYCGDNNAHGQKWYGCRLRNIVLACPSRALRLEFVSVRLFSRSRSMSMHVSGASMQEGTHATVCWSAGF